MPLIKSSAQPARVLLDRLLERPEPSAIVQSLPADTLVRLIQRVGLEDLGDLVALLSPEQLEQVFDQDLWSSERPGQDERFDAERFALWLAVLVEHSPELAAQKIKQLDFDLLALGLSKQLYVIDIEQLAQQMSLGSHSDEDEQLEKVLEVSLHHELEQYRVIAKNPRTFDAVLALMVELNTHDYPFLCALLERCCQISTEYIEDNGGLYEVLSAAEMTEEDVAGERERRREERGFVPPSSALAFLKLARQTAISELVASDTSDPITRAHFRSSGSPTEGARASQAHAPGVPGALGQAPDMDPATARLVAALGGLVELRPSSTPKLPGRAAKASLLASALTALCNREPQCYQRCVIEAAYLANVVLAGLGTAEQRFDPTQAAEVAFALCELGADELSRTLAWSKGARLAGLTDQIAKAGLVKLFRIGFHRASASKPPTRGKHAALLARVHRVAQRQGLAPAVTG